VRAQYAHGEVVQTARLNGKTGVISMVAGKRVTRDLEIEKILDLVHGALEGNEEGEEAQEESNEATGEEQNKTDERREQWEILGAS